MLKWTLGGFLLVISLIANGCCAPRIGVAPPCASIKVPSISDNHKVYRGQGLLVGNRLLTAGHTFLQEGSPFPPNMINVNGRMIWVRTHDHGNIETVRSLYGKEGYTETADFLEDWVAFEVEQSASRSVPQWSVGDGNVSPGQTLYAVRVDLIDKRPRLDSTPLIVAGVDSDEPIPEGLTVVTNPTKTHLGGWSGCFVGTYNDKENGWTLVGILISSQAEKGGSPEVLIVLRPPAKTLQWLVGQ